MDISHEKKNKVYLGDGSPSFRNYIRENQAELNLVKQYEELDLKKQDIGSIPNGHICMSDLLTNAVFHLNDIISILQQSKEIIFCYPAKVWENPDEQQLFLGLAKYLDNTRLIKWLEPRQWNKGALFYNAENFRLPDYIRPVDSRHDQTGQDRSTIWVAGCSFAQGDSLPNKDSRYGQVLADHFNLPVTFLTHSGASNEWLTDQILKSNLRENDIVVIGLTAVARTPIYLDNKYYPANLHALDTTTGFWRRQSKNLGNSDSDEYFKRSQDPKLKRYVPEEFLISSHFFYKTVNYVEQLVNILTLLKTRFVIMYNPVIEIPYIENISKMLHYVSSYDRKNLFITDFSCIDWGTDQIHPGPQQHKRYAEQIIAKINEIYS